MNIAPLKTSLAAPYDPQAGDVYACWGSDWVGRGISIRTSSPFGPWQFRWAPSHVAIASHRWYPGNNLRCFWFESTTLSKRPCLEAKRPVSGCQVHSITDRLQDYVFAGGRVAVYRLTEFDALTRHEAHHLREMLGLVVGDAKGHRNPITYDTAGALTSGTRIVKRWTLWRNQLDTLFCSELLAAVLQRLNRMCRANPSEFTPGQLMRALITAGTYQHLTTFVCPEDWRLR